MPRETSCFSSWVTILHSHNDWVLLFHVMPRPAYTIASVFDFGAHLRTHIVHTLCGYVCSDLKAFFFKKKIRLFVFFG